MATEIKVPAMGESVTEAILGRWLKKPGDAVELDEPVAELETDKAALEINAPAAGTLADVNVAEGDTVEVGTLLGAIEEGAPAAKKTTAKAKTEATPQAGAVAEKTEDKVETKAPAGSPAGETHSITVPALGESITEATVGQWYKKPGDAVAADEPVVELETDKTTMDVNAPVTGTLREIRTETGETVEVGAVIGTVAAGEGKPAEPAAAEAPERAAAEAKSAAASPVVRKLAGEHDIDLAGILGSGKDGRILKEDVLKAVEARKTEAPTPKEAPAPERPARPPREEGEREERVPMSGLRKRIAQRLKEAQNTAAMLTTFNEADMSEIVAVRDEYKELFEKKHNVRLGFMGFFVKACIVALHELPEVNAEIDGDDIIYKNHYDIGVAVSTPQGLVVPVLKDADRMSLGDIEKAIGDFGRRARDGKLSLNELQGGTFTISNGGVFGSLMSTPILNPPQSAILGMHKIQERPVAVNGEIEIRPMMYLALSYDHRIIDGREAVTFLVRLRELLEDPRRMLLDL